jgi:hypothetical protein
VAERPWEFESPYRTPLTSEHAISEPALPEPNERSCSPIAHARTAPVDTHDTRRKSPSRGGLHNEMLMPPSGSAVPLLLLREVQ